jgi:hypothetical protein
MLHREDFARLEYNVWVYEATVKLSRPSRLRREVA